MNKELIIAERKLLFISPGGEEILSSIQLGMPYESEGRGTLCDFEIPDIEEKRWAAGIDGIQAIILGMSLVESILATKAKKGWKIFWPDTKEEIDPFEIFDIDSFHKIRNAN